jgi:hypothetical protein
MFFSEPLQSLQTSKDGQNIEKNVNETNQMLQLSLHSMWQCKGIEKMTEKRHEWDVVIKGTKQVFYCLVGDCVNMTRSKLSGLNHHHAIKHLPPILPCPKGRVRHENVKRATKSPSKVKRQNEKIQYDVDARLCASI